MESKGSAGQCLARHCSSQLCREHRQCRSGDSEAEMRKKTDWMMCSLTWSPSFLFLLLEILY